VATAAAPTKSSLSKSDVVDQLAASTNLSKAQVSAVLNGTLDLIQETVKKGEKVTLTGCARARAAAQAAALPAGCIRPDTQIPALLGVWPRHAAAHAGTRPPTLREAARRVRGAALPPGRPAWRPQRRRARWPGAHHRCPAKDPLVVGEPPADLAARAAPRSFGTFEQRTRAARKGRNPSTGAELDIPASKARAPPCCARACAARLPCPAARLTRHAVRCDAPRAHSTRRSLWASRSRS
jgi:nucleoid DNA-binding protein